MLTLYLGVPAAKLANDTALKQRFLERRAVRWVLDREQHPLLKAG